MRHIPTSAEKVELLKKQAKRLQRKGGGKHTDLLDKVARGAGYDHWHHVTLCLKASSEADDLQDLLREIAIFQQMALRGETEIRTTGGDWLDGSLVLMAAAGDAWLFEPRTSEAMCLAFHGEIQAPRIRDLGDQIEMQFDGSFRIDGDVIELLTDHPLVGDRIAYGFPTVELKEAIKLASESFEGRFESVFLQRDAVPLNPELIEKLVSDGWNRSVLEDGYREGARYSPSRGTILSRPIAGKS